MLLGEADESGRVAEEVRRLLLRGLLRLHGHVRRRSICRRWEGERCEGVGRETVGLVAPRLGNFLLVDAAVVEVLVDCRRADQSGRATDERRADRTLSLLVDDEPSANREILVRRHQCPVLVKYREAHAVWVSRKRFHAPKHVLVVRVPDRVRAVELQSASLEYSSVARVDGRRSGRKTCQPFSLRRPRLSTHSIVSGSLPSSPIMMASGVRWPFPVAASEPYRPILSFRTLSRMPRSSRSCSQAVSVAESTLTGLTKRVHGDKDLGCPHWPDGVAR